jgi:hypothetical protein
MKDIKLELSDPSRSNQLKLINSNEDIAERLRLYLFKIGKGIEFFPIEKSFITEEKSKPDFYRQRHRKIKEKIRDILAERGEYKNLIDLQYFISNHDGKQYVFFLSNNPKDSRWEDLFIGNPEKIFNLVFKLYLLEKEEILQDILLDGLETINGFEELLFIHSKKLSKSKDSLFVWGQNVLVRYNSHNVITLTLSRTQRRFLHEDKYTTIDGDDLGELVIYKNQKYYFERKLDARQKNNINFMEFGDLDKFKKSQVYYYHALMNKLENFLKDCGINFEVLNFQADHYLANKFISQVDSLESIESLEIINNTGIDLTENQRNFLINFLKQQGISQIIFYQNGKTISTYKELKVDNEDNPSWEINEVVPWIDIELCQEKNYLVFNKLLSEETGSMSYQIKERIWQASDEIEKKDKVDFYSQLKRKYRYVDRGIFISVQGIDVSEFQAIGSQQPDSILNYKAKNIDRDILRLDTRDFTNEEFLEIDDSLINYLAKQNDGQEWQNFCKKYELKIDDKFKKVLVELKLKNWLRQSLLNPNHFGLPITPQSFSEKEFFVIYVRSPRNSETKAVAIECLYRDGCIYIKNALHNLKEIEKKFTFLRRRKNNPDQKLINDQEYFVDKSLESYISCYTDDFYTPTLIGKPDLLEEIESGSPDKLSRQATSQKGGRLFPLVIYYNGTMKPANRIKKLICLDLHNQDFIQYYVPLAQSLRGTIAKGFKVYHLIGKKPQSQEAISSSELMKHPLTALHFSTLTYNLLRISENSQSSLLQKMANILIEN